MYVIFRILIMKYIKLKDLKEIDVKLIELIFTLYYDYYNL